MIIGGKVSMSALMQRTYVMSIWRAVFKEVVVWVGDIIHESSALWCVPPYKAVFTGSLLSEMLTELGGGGANFLLE